MRFVYLCELTRPAGPSILFASRWVNEKMRKKERKKIIIKSKTYQNEKKENAKEWIIPF